MYNCYACVILVRALVAVCTVCFYGMPAGPGMELYFCSAGHRSALLPLRALLNRAIDRMVHGKEKEYGNVKVQFFCGSARQSIEMDRVNRRGRVIKQVPLVPL